MNSLDFSSHFWIRSMLFSSTFWTNSLLFSSTSRTFLFTLSTRSCRWYFFSWREKDRLTATFTLQALFSSIQTKAKVSYVNEADVELLCCVSSLQVASDVHVIVADYACDDVGGGDALCALGGSEHTCGGHLKVRWFEIHSVHQPEVKMNWRDGSNQQLKLAQMIVMRLFANKCSRSRAHAVIFSIYDHVFHKVVSLAPSHLGKPEPLIPNCDTITCHQWTCYLWNDPKGVLWVFSQTFDAPVPTCSESACLYNIYLYYTFNSRSHSDILPVAHFSNSFKMHIKVKILSTFQHERVPTALIRLDRSV